MEPKGPSVHHRYDKPRNLTLYPLLSLINFME